MQVWACSSFFFHCEIIPSSYLLFFFVWTDPFRGGRSQSPVSISPMVRPQTSCLPVPPSAPIYWYVHYRSSVRLQSASVWPLWDYQQDIACLLFDATLCALTQITAIGIYPTMLSTNSIIFKITYTLLYLLIHLIYLDKILKIHVLKCTYKKKMFIAKTNVTLYMFIFVLVLKRLWTVHAQWPQSRVTTSKTLSTSTLNHTITESKWLHFKRNLWLL